MGVCEGISSVGCQSIGGSILSSVLVLRWRSALAFFCEAFKSEANFSTIFMYERVSFVAITQCLVFKRSKDCAAQFSSRYFCLQLPSFHAFHRFVRIVSFVYTSNECHSSETLTLSFLSFKNRVIH